ncbi:MAG TPA: adenylate/guanylate cyclase domain-containing protein [Candidatus Rifleibacterium sp.]|nr:adenylate/guanylate cyclase domain-containing protein [Candidatus Rifleibacterium sp.]
MPAGPQKKKVLQLAPLPLWKWMAVIFLLLSVPVFIMFRQATSSFRSNADIAEAQISQQVEKLVSRFAFEASTSVQVRELLRDYASDYVEPLKTAALMRQLRQSPIVEALPGLHYALLLNEIAMLRVRQAHEKRLRKLLPGLKLVKWGLDLAPLPDSDQLVPKWPYQKLTESIARSINPSGGPRAGVFDYLENVPMLTRYFTDAHGLSAFLKDGDDMLICGNPAGNKLMMLWHSEKAHYINAERRCAGGFLAVVEADRLTGSFGLQTLMRRKSHEWKNSGVAAGWIVENEPAKRYLPYPFPAADEKEWANWLLTLPDGTYKRQGVLLALRRSADGLLLLAVSSTRDIQMRYERKVFFAGLFIIMVGLLPVIFMATQRRNNGMAVSIRFQIAGLFVIAMLLPAAAIFQLGNDLLFDRQKSFESDAYKEMDRIKKDLDENMGFAFRQLEKISETIGRQLMGLNFRPDGRFVRPEPAVEAVKQSSEQVQILHAYLLNSYAEVVFSSSESENESEGGNLLPLVQSIAKIKLRAAGKLQVRGKVLDVSLMDLVVEATGGSNLEEIKAILSTRENRAFEMQFSGRRSIFFIGQFSTPQLPGETFSLVLLLRDSHFERMYMRLMIDRICRQTANQNRIQLYFGANSCGSDGYFLPAPLDKPWFDYINNSPDSLRVGRLSEQTRFTGNSVKDTLTLDTGSKKCLFYSFKPACLEQTAVVALFNYEEIVIGLRRLSQFIIISLLVSVMVMLVLARIMARSLIEPVVLLKQGVEEVESGNFNTAVVLPGSDEMVELAQAFNKMNQGLDERERMTRYLSRSAVNAVVSGEDRQMGGRRVPATILFSDIRSFTTISEANSAEEVVKLLNEYFAAMNIVVERFGGDIDKFIGDAIMAQFITGDDMNPASLALNAVRCALGMMQALAEFNQQRVAKGLFTLKIGVGINSGEVIAGNIGSPGRMDRTVIGDTVNVASRLEGMSKLGRHTCVIISRSTLELVRHHVEVEQLAETAVKGKTTVVEMFEVIRLTEYN